MLEDRLTLSFVWGGNYLSSEWDQTATYDPAQVSADFNADGCPDFFQVQGGWADSDWSVDPIWITYESVLLGRADGTFQQWDSWIVGSEPELIGTGDFNGDARPDVVTYEGGLYSVMLNDGNWGPSINVSNPTIAEGNTGMFSATFTVSLSAPPLQPVTVHYATSNGTASAGSDYQAASGTLTFAPGETSKTINVLINGDRVAEPNEAFAVNLSGATNATIADGQGVGTIVDDEPRISISDVSKTEGKKNQSTLFTFTVTLSAAYDQPVTMSFRTVNGAANTSDGDYVAKTGTLTFNPGETIKTITITVNGDNKREASEYFYLDLFANSSNSSFTKNRGVGTILNDD